MIYLLTGIFGPSDFGLRCNRIGERAQCEVLQTRFLGVFGNSIFTIPESEIAGAVTICAGNGVGGRRDSSCAVNLTLKSGQYRNYPVLSYPLREEAEASARNLNDYFTNPSAPPIEIHDEIAQTLVLLLGLPVFGIGCVLILRWRSRRIT